MKTLLFLFILSLSSYTFSQNVININEIELNEDIENVLIKKLDTDSNSTSFLIWVKKEVPSHKHATHSELIYVLEGQGIITVDGSKTNIGVGDYFRIPENTFHGLEVVSKKPMKVISVQAPEFLSNDRIFEEDTKK
ncbi:MAG: cupin domain-containing protein [Flavobacteriales bacterium CG_4_9_14_3_um_filter_32_8]|nr:MAG: cupin domain-containing protein [Flavobacteriales bacterium CG_4_9_14_3_um_filter_32_8]